MKPDFSTLEEVKQHLEATWPVEERYLGVRDPAVVQSVFDAAESYPVTIEVMANEPHMIYSYDFDQDGNVV